MLWKKDKNEVLNFPSILEISSFWLYFQSSWRTQLHQFIILLRFLMCALYLDKVLETPVTDLREEKGQSYVSAGLAGALELISKKAKGGVSPHKEDSISPFRLASPTKLSSASICWYSRTNFWSPLGKAMGSFSGDIILHSTPNTNGDLC